MLIKNALVFNENYTFEKKDISISNEYISINNDDGETIDAEGLYAVPGLIDLHFHGAVGYDFCDGTNEAFDAISRYEAKNGITSLCPSTLTLPLDRLVDICKNIKNFTSSKDGADIVGIHLEGPFLSDKKIGAQNPAYLIKPSLEAFNRLYKASDGLTKIISIAPETDGAIEFISAVSNKIICSIAHTTANYNLTISAIKAGVSHITHLFNAMPPFLHRDPGVVGGAFDSPQCSVELITDGVHIHPSMVRATLKLFGDDRVIFISDSMMATGLTDGDYSLGGLAVKVTGNKAVLNDGTIAGSATNLMNCLKTAVNQMRIPLTSALKCASVNPAKELGIYDKYGSISVGKYANIVLLDKQLNVKNVILRGIFL